MQGTTAVDHGVSPEDALKALTLNSARIMGIDERVGSLEKGKDADVVVLSGPPFEAATRVEGVIVNGKVGWKRESDG